VKEKEEDFLCPLKEAPEIVRIDPELTVLAKVNFKPPTAMLHVQLADSSDMIGRLLAIEQLATKKDHESVEKLKTALSNDAFWGVRIKAAEALRSIHTDEALDALLASMSQTESRARNAVVEAIGGFYHPKAYEAAQKTLATEKNPVIQAAAIRAVGAYANPDVRETLLKFLNSDSYRQRLAEAAIAAMRAQDDAGYIAPLLDCLAKREQALTSDSFAAGLGALAFLTRNESKKDDVREFLTGRVRHMKERVRQAAIAALGTLQDPKAVAVLETFSSAAKDSPERQAAEKAITSIREAQKTSVDLKTLRNEVLDLQKSNRNLKKDLDELKKKVEAGESKPATDGKK
jgi:aminopeptidase N